ncbi:SCO family protein [Paraburkholderia dinghuensis]|uniref:Cytochrome C oxidase subunit I n=1 Tax=Paraburkholderia dinghuensis TaxID=2305225 RepID=A0A3N6PRT9_9BURK|nr:cytochrome C oxidase subunit I [Paraburkholderia dinghuensis]RQH04630.1 cytochrome C oxidase subunit I [Paraburkholderia dinghuensis]
MSTQTPRSTDAGRSASPSPTQPDGRPKGSWQRGRWTLLAIALICAAPIVLSYFTYYVIKPKGGTTSYGELVAPQRPIPESLMVTGDDGHTVPLASLKGRWLMISVDGGACGDACATKLYFMRQVRAAQGVERERIVTVWLRTDGASVSDVLKTVYPDTRMLRADPAALAQWFPATDATKDTDHIYLVDPNGNLMMRFPAHADPSKINRDVTKLLKWSRIG